MDAAIQGKNVGVHPMKNIATVFMKADDLVSVLNGREACVICLKEDHKAIGIIERKLNGHTDMTRKGDECETDNWLAKPFWGHRLMPEAAREMLCTPLRI